MRGFGDFQRSQMRKQDSQIADRFDTLRQAVNALERAVIASPDKPQPREPNHSDADDKRSERSTERCSSKLAYSVKETLALVGLSRTALYAAITAKELRAVKHHKKMLILAKDLHAWLERLPEIESSRRVNPI